MTPTHKFSVKRTDTGYVTCCGTSIFRITKDVDPDMVGSVNWYFQDANEYADDSPFLSYADIKSYLMRRDHREEWILKVMADADAALAKAGA